jgi:hypothetical protein
MRRRSSAGRRRNAGPSRKRGAERRTHDLLFVDQSGFYLLPAVVRTYAAPVGKTPVLVEHLSRDHLSAISAITPEKASST